MDIPSKIIALREAAGWSKNKLAKEAGISQAYVSQLESGQKQPGIDVLSRICSALGISLAEFFQDNTQAPDTPHEVRRIMDKVQKLSPDKIKVLESVLDTWIEND
jgi:transcriptional regulator with XRE-family HTH domain